MKFNSDSHFVIGKDHLSQGKPCQDYALSGYFDNLAYAIVSDGCSSGDRTDIGARIISLVIETNIKNARSKNIQKDKLKEEDDEYDKNLPVKLSDLQENLGLSTDDMLATCLYAYVTPTSGFVRVLGDGVVGLVYKSGYTSLFKFDWENNTPFYPIYAVDRLDTFLDEHKHCQNPLKVEVHSYHSILAITENSFTAIEGIFGKTISITDLNDDDPIEYIALFSDGVCQVEDMHWTDVALQLLEFKSNAGVFVKRKLNAFIKNNAKRSKSHLDDISMSVIHIDRS